MITTLLALSVALSAPVPQTQLLSGSSNVGTYYRVSPDDRWVLYEADFGGIYLAPIDGSAPAELVGGVFFNFEDLPVFTDDSSHVVMLSGGTSVTGIRAVPTSDPSLAVEITGGSGFISEFEVSSDASFVIYTQLDGFYDYDVGLFRAPVDGLSPSYEIAPGVGDVSSFVLDPTGEWVVFRISNTGNLYRVPADGSQPAVQLNTGTQDVEELPGYAIDPTGERVVWTTEFADLWGASLDDGVAYPLVVVGPGVRTAPLFTPDGADVLFVSGNTIGSLYRVPTAGGAPAASLSGGDNRVRSDSPRLSGDGSRAVYASVIGGKSELYSVPVDGSEPPVKISHDLVLEGDDVIEFGIGPQDQRVAYRTSQGPGMPSRLFTAAIDGSGEPHARTDDAGLGNVTGFAFLPGGHQLVYRAVPLGEGSRVFRTSVVPGLDPIAETPSNVPGLNVTDTTITGDGRLLYRADAMVNQQFGLFVRELRSPRTRAPGAPGGGGSLGLR